MKKMLIGLVLLGAVTGIAYASFSSRKNNKQTTEKKSDSDRMEKKKECKKHCLFS
jgi:hypothetical protein